jgi:hypothetical protein
VTNGPSTTARADARHRGSSRGNWSARSMFTSLQRQQPAGAQPAALPEMAAVVSPKASWQRLPPHPSSPQIGVSSIRQTIESARSMRRPRRLKPTAASRSRAIRVRSSMNSGTLISQADPDVGWASLAFPLYRTNRGRQTSLSDSIRMMLGFRWSAASAAPLKNAPPYQQ